MEEKDAKRIRELLAQEQTLGEAILANEPEYEMDTRIAASMPVTHEEALLISAATSIAGILCSNMSSQYKIELFNSQASALIKLPNIHAKMVRLNMKISRLLATAAGA